MRPVHDMTGLTLAMQVDFSVFEDGAQRDLHSLIARTAGAFVVTRAILFANSKAD